MHINNRIKFIKTNGTRSLFGIVAAISLAALSMSASAGVVVPPLVFNTAGAGADVALSARAEFSVSGSQLIVKLSNTSLADVTDLGQLLHAVYWDMTSTCSLNLVSAIAEKKCTFSGGGVSSCTSGTFAATVGNGNNGSQVANFKYDGNTPASPVGMKGIGSAGLGNFGGTDGPDWGILSAGDNLTTFSGGMIQNSPFAKNAVTFTLDIKNANGSACSTCKVGDLGIKNVLFNYGTDCHILGNSSKCPSVPPAIPEPAILGLFPLAFGLMLRSLRNRRNLA